MNQRIVSAPSLTLAGLAAIITVVGGACLAGRRCAATKPSPIRRKSALLGGGSRGGGGGIDGSESEPSPPSRPVAEPVLRLSVTVPEDAVPGQLLRISLPANPDRSVGEVVLPSTAAPGDKLQVRISHGRQPPRIAFANAAPPSDLDWAFWLLGRRSLCAPARGR